MNTPSRAALLTSCLAALLLPLPETVAAQDAPVRILCSNGIRAAVQKLLPPSVKIQYGASAVLKRSIESGEPFDLAFLSQPTIADLIKEGKIAAGTSVDLAASGIGIAIRAGAPKPDVSTPAAIKQTLLQSKSIGYVKEGAGTPAVLNVLNSLGISEDVQRKMVVQPGAEQSMASLAAGHVDLAFALISEIGPAAGVQLAGPLPPEFQKRIILSAGVSSSTKNREAALAIIKSLTTPAAAAAIKAAGMDPIANEK